jgi:hypothetical protein
MFHHFCHGFFHFPAKLPLLKLSPFLLRSPVPTVSLVARLFQLLGGLLASLQLVGPEPAVVLQGLMGT